MANMKAKSPEEAVDEYFDMLIKSRFIEMFGRREDYHRKWTMRTFNECCHAMYGFPFDSTYFNEEGNGIRLIRIRDINTGLSETYTTECVDEQYLVNNGDLLVSMDGDFRAIIWGSGPALLNQRTCKMSGRSELIDDIFLLHYLRLELDIIHSRTSATTVKHLSAKEINRFSVPVPPLTIQKRFADFVKQADKSRIECKRIFQSFDNLVKSRFIEMFGHISLNEMDNPEFTLGEVCSLITDGSHYSPADEPGEAYPMLSVKDIRGGAFDYVNCKRIGKEAYEKLVREGCRPLKNDVLIAKDGSVFQKSVVVTEEIDQVILSSIAILRPDLDRINPIFLEHYLMSESVKEDAIRNYTTGTAIRRIILKNLTKMKLMVPEIEEQNRFADFVKRVDKSKFSSQSAGT